MNLHQLITEPHKWMWLYPVSEATGRAIGVIRGQAYRHLYHVPRGTPPTNGAEDGILHARRIWNPYQFGMVWDETGMHRITLLNPNLALCKQFKTTSRHAVLSQYAPWNIVTDDCPTCTEIATRTGLETTTYAVAVNDDPWYFLPRAERIFLGSDPVTGA